MRWPRFLVPPSFETEEENRAALVLHVVLLSAGGIVLSLGLVVPWFSHQREMVVAIYVSFFVIVTLSWILLRSRHVRASAIAFCGAMWLFCTTLVWFFGGPLSPELFTFIPIILITGVVWSERAAIVMAALTAMATLAMVWAESAGRLPPSAEMEPIRMWAGFSGALGMTAFLLILGLRMLRSAVVEAERSEKQLSMLIRDSPDGFVLLDAGGSILTFNRAAEAITGYRSRDLLGHRLQDLDLFPPSQDLFADSGTNREYSSPTELEIRHKDGRHLAIEANSARVTRNDGTEAFQITLRDVSRRKQAEQAKSDLETRLQHAQKLEAVGRLAGGIAHDFNNLITAIKGYSELALLRLPDDAILRGDLEEISKAVDRAAALTRQLLAFSRRQVLQPAVLDLNVVVRDMNMLLRRVIGEDVELATRLAANVGCVYIDPGQLEQVIVNLAVNARDAMPEGGRLTLTTAELELAEERLIGRVSVPPGRYAVLEVADTGGGMDETVKEHLFEPFFTTKPKGQGTGLGLSSVYGIVKQSGGFIWVESEPGRGARFTILLPLTDRETRKETRQRRRATPIVTAGSETILLVEDEDTVRDLALRVLEDSGYHVLVEASGNAALRRQRQHPDRIDLLLTDLVLPDVHGQELARQLRQLRPDLKVLTMSGYTETAKFRQDLLEPGFAFIAKPFSPEELLQKVREVLGASNLE